MTRPGGRLPTICFVTYELAPITAGGVGTYVTRVIPELAGRLRVLVLADMAPEDVAAYRRLGLHDPCGTGINRAVSVDDVAPEAVHHPNVFVRNTQRFAHALAALCREESVDLIEMPEYAGMAYAALKMKRQHGAFAGQRLVVRLHGSLELIDYHGGTASWTLERRLIYGMERYALRHADTLVAPTEDTFADYRSFYGLDREPLICRPPVGPEQAVPGAGTGSAVLCVGRVQAIKGVDLFVRAAVRWIAEGAPPGVRFRIVGLDVVPEHEGFRRYVEALIPPHARQRVEFLGHRSAAEIRDLAGRARLAVVPSRWESFGYVARELLALGLPVVGSRIAGFRELEGVAGMEFFDGTVEDLTAAIKRLWHRGGEQTAPPVLPPPLPVLGDVYARLAAEEPPPIEAAVESRVDRLALDANTEPTPPGGTSGGGRGAAAAPPAGAHRRLSEWLQAEREDYVAVLLKDWPHDEDALRSAAALLARDAELAAVELLPRYVPSGLLADPQVPLLALTEADELTRAVLGIAPAALVFRRPRERLDLLPGTAQDVMRQLVSQVGGGGRVELAWPPGEVPRWPLVGAEPSPDGMGLAGPADPTQRWLLGYLARCTTQRPAGPRATVVGPLYLARRSWQILRADGVRAYLQKVVDVARQRPGRR
jgi:glycosyltransferase involved in cell wall biosynthesis